MKPFVWVLLLSLATANGVLAAEVPPVMKGFKMDADQMKQTEEIDKLTKQLRQIDGSYEREINAWFKEAAVAFTRADEYHPDGSWAVDRRRLLKKLDDIEGRKNPQIDVLRNQMDKKLAELIKSYRPDQEIPLSEMPIRRLAPKTSKPASGQLK